MLARGKSYCVKPDKWVYAGLKTPSFFAFATHVFYPYAALLSSKHPRFRRRLNPFTYHQYDEGAQEARPSVSSKTRLCSGLPPARQLVSSRSTVVRSGRHQKNIFSRYFLVIAWILGSALPAHAIDPVSQIQQAEDYLNGIKTLTADFTQITPNGGLGKGKLYLQRPGKMRWDYEPPTPLLMVTKGDTLIYYDKDLQEVSYLSLDDTMVSFLTRAKINFKDDALRIVNLREGAGSLRFTLLQTARQDEGSLTLVFRTEPVRLHQLVVSDATGQITEITMENIRLDQPLDQELFEFKDPNFGRGIRR